MVCCVQHSDTLAHVLKFYLKQCFGNGPLCAAQWHTGTRTEVLLKHRRNRPSIVEVLKHRQNSENISSTVLTFHHFTGGADKSLARPRKKQTRKHVRDARDFNNIETGAVTKFFLFSCKEIHAILTETLACFPSWSV